MINQRLNEAVARKFGYNGPADSEAVDKFLMSKPESVATVRRALNIMKPTTAMAEGGDTETTATTTPVEPDDVPTKTPEEMAEEVVQGQRQMVRDAFVDPQALVAKPEVAKIDPAAAGRTIDPTAGQITAPLPQAGQPDFFTQIQQPPTQIMATPETLPGYVNRGLEALPSPDTQIFDPRIRAMEEKRQREFTDKDREFYADHLKKTNEERRTKGIDISSNPEEIAKAFGVPVESLVRRGGITSDGIIRGAQGHTPMRSDYESSLDPRTEGGKLSQDGRTGLYLDYSKLTAPRGSEAREEQYKKLVAEKLATVKPLDPYPMEDIFLTNTQLPTEPLSPSGVARTTTAATPEPITPETVDAKTASEEVTTALADVDPVTGTVSDAAKVTAATMDPATTGVKDLTSAQGEAVVMTNPVQREIQDGELVSGAADATKAAAFTEQVQAATATPSEQATVQGQLSTLMTQFEGGNTPAWAAGAMRAATAAMAARGLGASSMAGQAVVQAAMESALPVAMADAQTQATFEAQNLSNRQQRAMLAAQQRATFMGQEFDQAFQARVSNAAKISDVANMNFTAEQQVALENSRNANTINMANLTNKQAMVLAEASAIAQLETQNLSNQQQAAVQNANSFLQMDMSNINNAQQTSMFKAQSVVQSLLTDQAAENAARQFNASSENQTKQFMANLNTQVTQFNAAQANAISQFNAGETNALDKFNASMEEQRNQFNAQNGLVVAQANAQWRQNVDTLNTAAQNEANMINAATVNTFTKATVDQIWQRERDLMDYAFKGTEQEKDRMVNIMLGEKELSQYQTQAEQNRKSNEDTAKYSLLTQLILS